MAVRTDCRHYSTRSMPGGDAVQRCRLNANDATPFGCPEHCLFFEPRAVTATGWDIGTGEDDPPPS